MEYRSVGESGLQLSVAGLGCNNFGMRLDKDESTAVVRAALDAGVTHFDTADSYAGGKSEEFLGAALRGVRDDVVIATKVGNPTGPGPYDHGGSRRHVIRAAEDSLRRLGTDHIDLYYLHRPDPLTPVEETLAALGDLVRAGKVRYIGCSSMAGWQIAQAAHVADRHGLGRFIVTQDEWSLLVRDVEAEVVPACAAYGIGVIPYFPLAAGMLTGKYQEDTPAPEGTRFAASSYFDRYRTGENHRIVNALSSCARELDRSMIELALGWLLAQPTVASVPVGASTPEQVAMNTAALERELGEDEAAAVTAAIATSD